MIDHTDTPSNTRLARRRVDREATLDQRFLDWGERASDIALLPHSPLALEYILTHPDGGRLILQPIDKLETLPQPTRSDASGQASLRQHEKRRSVANLLTQHETDALQEQCKRIQIENALVKQHGIRQLYLVAGLLAWVQSDAHGGRKRFRAPLLMYPVLLSRVPRNEQYELRLDGSTPEFNHHLLTELKHRFDLHLPKYQAHTPLNQYFAELAEALQGHTNIQLQFETALGNAACLADPGTGRNLASIPRVPDRFDATLALSIASNSNLTQLAALLQLIPDYRHFNRDSIDSQGRPPRMTSVVGLRKYAARLAAEGLEQVEFRQLSALPVRLEKWASQLSRCLSSRLLNQTLARPNVSVRELIKLSTIIELIDKSPIDIEQFAHSHLAYFHSLTLYQRARHQARLVEEESLILQRSFVLERIPSRERLLSLINELDDGDGSNTRIVDERYFQARRQIAEFCVQRPGDADEYHHQELRQLARFLRFRELFVNNTEYRAALGPGYRGMRTDWSALERTLAYAQELTEVLDSQEMAARALENWSEFRSGYIDELDTLLQSAEAARRLLSVVGVRWQNQKLSALIAQARITASRLTEWEQVYGPAESHADKTAAMVLSSFSGTARDDVLVETRVDEMQTRIQRQLVAGQLSQEQVADTIGWLQAASDAAQAAKLDIEDIFTHLQIA